MKIDAARARASSKGETPQDNVSFISGGGAPFSIDGTPLATDALVLDTGLDFPPGRTVHLRKAHARSNETSGFYA